MYKANEAQGNDECRRQPRLTRLEICMLRMRRISQGCTLDGGWQRGWNGVKCTELCTVWVSGLDTGRELWVDGSAIERREMRMRMSRSYLWLCCPPLSSTNNKIILLCSSTTILCSISIDKRQFCTLAWNRKCAYFIRLCRYLSEFCHIETMELGERTVSFSGKVDRQIVS